MMLIRLSLMPSMGSFRAASSYSLKNASKSSCSGIRSRTPSPTVARRLKVKRSARPWSSFPQRQNLLDVVPGQGEHDHGIDAKLSQPVQKVEGSAKMPPAPDIVVVAGKSLKAYLKERRRGDLNQALHPLHGGGVPQDGKAQAQVPGGPVEFQEARVEKWVASGECHLPPHMHVAAKAVKIFQDRESPVMGHHLPVAAIVTVLAVQVACLGDVPLEGEDLGFQERGHGRIGRVRQKFTPNPGRGRPEKPFSNGTFQGLPDHPRLHLSPGCGLNMGDLFQDDLQGQQVLFFCLGHQDRAGFRMTPDHYMAVTGGRGGGGLRRRAPEG